jgi:hypothetical protein
LPSTALTFAVQVESGPPRAFGAASTAVAPEDGLLLVSIMGKIRKIRFDHAEAIRLENEKF